jgi:hypothetical protein
MLADGSVNTGCGKYADAETTYRQDPRHRLPRAARVR